MSFQLSPQTLITNTEIKLEQKRNEYIAFRDGMTQCSHGPIPKGCTCGSRGNCVNRTSTLNNFLAEIAQLQEQLQILKVEQENRDLQTPNTDSLKEKVQLEPQEKQGINPLIILGGIGLLLL